MRKEAPGWKDTNNTCVKSALSEPGETRCATPPYMVKQRDIATNHIRHNTTPQAPEKNAPVATQRKVQNQACAKTVNKAATKQLLKKRANKHDAHNKVDAGPGSDRLRSDCGTVPSYGRRKTKQNTKIQFQDPQKTRFGLLRSQLGCLYHCRQ